MAEFKNKILIIEDDVGISRFIKASLAQSYEVLEASTGNEALSIISSHCPDLILLDLGLPDMDGTEIITSVRSWTAVPIIIISARSSESDKASALDLGADDYLTKPFGTVELHARIRTALRHAHNVSGSETALTGLYTVGELTIDYNKHRVYLAGKDCNLTPNEFRIIALLGRQPGRVITYRALMRELWGPTATNDNKILRVHVCSIRRKIEPNPNEPRYLFTETAVGYRLAEDA